MRRPRWLRGVAVLAAAVGVLAQPAQASAAPPGISFTGAPVYRYGGGVAVFVPLHFSCPTNIPYEYANLRLTQIVDRRAIGNSGTTPDQGPCPAPERDILASVIPTTDAFRAGKLFAVLTDGNNPAAWSPRSRVLIVPATDSSPLVTSSRKIIDARRAADGHQVTMRVSVRCAAKTATDVYASVIQASPVAGASPVGFSGMRQISCTGSWQTVSMPLLNGDGRPVRDGPAFASSDQAAATVTLTRSAHA